MVLQFGIGCPKLPGACRHDGALVMKEERDELKGKLLLLWLEDLRNDREPRICSEVESLKPDDIREVMALARFLKAAEWQSEVSVDLDKYAQSVSERVLRDNLRDAQHTADIIQASITFSNLLCDAINSLKIDRGGLQESLVLPRYTLSDLESGRMPPHRLPVETMLKLLRTLRADTKEVVSLIRRSALQWATSTYQQGQVQLGRVDPFMSDEERVRLMRNDNADLTREVARIDKYCADLTVRLAD